MKPRYTHDCDRCTYIASVVSFGQLVDLYRSCGSEGGYIARFSSEGGDYATVSKPRDQFSRALDGQLLLPTDFMTCEAVERTMNANAMRTEP